MSIKGILVTEQGEFPYGDTYCPTLADAKRQAAKAAKDDTEGARIGADDYATMVRKIAKGETDLQGGYFEACCDAIDDALAANINIAIIEERATVDHFDYAYRCLDDYSSGLDPDDVDEDRTIAVFLLEAAAMDYAKMEMTA